MNKNSTNYPEILYEKLKELNNDDGSDEDSPDIIKEKLFNYQQSVYNYMTKTDQRGILLYHSVGSGKCMKIDTPILMYDGGIKKIQDIKIGDQIMGDDSGPRNVLSLARGADRMYDVMYNNGEKYTVNEAHILCLKVPSYPELIYNEKGCEINWLYNNEFCTCVFYYRNNNCDEIKYINRQAIEFYNTINFEQIVEISIIDYLKLSDSKKEILKGYKTQIVFPEKKTPIDPYVIGVWLGDVNTDRINVNLKENECKFMTDLKKIHLVNNKHIPLLYKCNSRKNQLSLLAGLLDSRGAFSKKKGFNLSFNNLHKHDKLLKDIIYLCRSLGFLCYTKNDKKITKIFIYGKYIDEIPVLEFPDDIWKSQNAINRDKSNGTKIQVKYSNIDNYFGFTIDGNSRYVLGDFTVTHNTITSISIAEHFRQLNRDIIIISSKSLQNNYRKEISGFSKKLNPDINEEEIEEIISKYKFITSNAKNMIKSLETKHGGDIPNNLSKPPSIDNILTDINKSNLENKIIIIDEAHNLFNSISNGSKIANEFYDIIMNTKHIKLIFLTGTPIVNNPFEISICFNMLYGPIFKKSNTSKRKKDYISIMPEYYTDFQKYFINESNTGNGVKNMNIKNEDKFQNRIFGLVSYYGDLYFEKQSNISDELKKTLKKENYPDRLPVKFEVVEMSQLQNIEYSKARETEKRENSSFFNGGEINGGAIFKEKNAVSTSYRIKSRQFSNIYIPNSPTKLEKFNINKYSPKLEKMFENINKNYTNTVTLVYSTFLEYGIKAFAKILELNDYKLYNPNGEYMKGTKYFALFSGDQTLEEKADILQRLNLDDNKYGELISVLLISKSGVEGLDLKNIRSVHIMEPYWNFSLIQQVIARGVRYKSHIALPDEERNVQTYIYLSDYNKDFLENEKNKLKEKQKKSNKKVEGIEFTTDINMFKSCIKRQELIYKFLKLIASTSIECPEFNKQSLNFDCFTCISNDKQLFYEDIHQDMELSNPCIKSKKIKAEEVIINGNKYYYTKVGDEISVFKYNEGMGGYQQIYDENIIEKIKKL
jgi:superfamily II DNA or RNA helicase